MPNTTRPRPLTDRRRRWGPALVVGLLTAMLVTLGGGASIAGSGDGLVRTIGDETLTPNVQVQANLKFTPGKVRIGSGDSLTVRHDDKTTAPHTLTLVDASEQPQTFEDLFDPTFCPTCDAALGAHFSSFPPTAVVDGGDGFNEVGDSVLFFEDESLTVDVTAPSGATLAFICAIHPWMQGTLIVP